MRCRNGTSERRRTRERRTKKCPRQPAIPARAIAPTASAPTVSAPRAKTLKRANQRALRGRYAVACYRARVLVPKTLFSLVVCNTYPLTSRDQTHVPNRKRLLSLSLARARFPAKKPQRTSVLARRALFLGWWPRLCASFLDSFRCCRRCCRCCCCLLSSSSSSSSSL